MQPNTRAMIAASAHAIVVGRKVGGVHDHASGRDLRIAAECRGNRVQALDGDRSAKFDGILPELYDHAGKAFISLERDGWTVRGYDRASGSAYVAEVEERLVQLYDHGESTWFSFGILTV